MLPLYDDNPTVRTPYVSYGLIAINLAVMLWLSQLSQLNEQVEVIKHGFVPQRIQQFSNPKLIVQVPVELEAPQGDFRFAGQRPPVEAVQLDPVPVQILASLLTSMFLHGGWLHVLGNMWFLWIFGNNVEDRLGPVIYFVFYLVGGLLATASHWAYDPSSTIPVIGASGAVATILGAYAVTFPKAKVHTLLFIGIVTTFEMPALVWLGLWFGGELVQAVFIGKDLTVAVWAHIGGFLAGVLLMPILSFRGPPPGDSWHEEVSKNFSLPPTDWR
ncbi:MAG: rhomboid family intramembrane serine protease [Planctomycetia bacterium]|nr:rhomboid family intramembrane serine protease [Planctomycetia bacterium]